MQGKLIVIEGVDSSGKRTQAELLAKKLKEAGKPTALVSFPRYETFSGKLVTQYLQGKFGSLAEVKPEFAALLYALDRYNALPWLEQQLSQGKIVVCDRYTETNVAHQGAKFKDPKERQRFIEWLEAVEARLPKPSLTFFLDLPVEVSVRLMQHREKDIHELDKQYLEATRQLFLELCKKENWVKIQCEDSKAGIKPKEEISAVIYQKLCPYL